MSNNQIVFSRSVCLELINRGFLCIDIQIGNRDKKPVYVFESTDAFKKVFDEIVYSRQAIKATLRRDELEMIIRSLSSQQLIFAMDAETIKADKDKVTRLIDVLSRLVKDETKAIEDDDLIG